MKSIVTFLLGTATGVLAGILLAPKSGDKTRKEVQDKLKDQLTDIEKAIHDQSRNFRKQYNGKIDEVSKKGKKLLDQAGAKIKA